MSRLMARVRTAKSLTPPASAGFASRPSLSVSPGATLFTSTPRGPSSVASERVIDTTAPLLAT